MHILALKETAGLFISALSSFIVNYSSIYLGNTTRSWSFAVYVLFLKKTSIREKDIPWSKRGFQSFTIYVGRLLKENLFFKENNIGRPRMWFYTYFFIYNMVFDIIFHTLFIFLAHYIFYVYFLAGYGIFKIFALISVLQYQQILDYFYYKKEKENWKLREDAIKKIKKSNPHFFDFYDPSILEKFMPQYADFGNNFDQPKFK